MGTFAVIWHTIVYVVTFWYIKLFGWWRSKSPKAIWMERLRSAKTYDDWELAALQLDKLFGFDLWRETTSSPYYDWALIKDRVKLLHDTRVDQALHHGLPNLIRSGLVRNLGNITSPKLYNCAFAGTKLIIDEYISQVIQGIDVVLNIPNSPPPGLSPVSGGPFATPNPTSSATDGGPADWRPLPLQGQQHQTQTPPPPRHQKADSWSSTSMPSISPQTKLNFIHDTRQAFGRTCLILQGGSVFGMCHIGVVKTLFDRGLLPQVITGTAVGALIAALVAIHTDEELPQVLSGGGIDLSAFRKSSLSTKASAQASSGGHWRTLLRRLKRFWKKGYFLDMEILEQCVRDNVGDLTFQEAFKRTNRVLNITVATSEQGGVPTVLNHITSPHVLIWTAAAASNADFPSLYGRETQLLCKRPNGQIERWGPANAINFRHWTEAKYSDRNAPFRRVAELFNVNNYIVSQARPYAIPFLQPDMHGPSFIGRGGLATSIMSFLLRITALEMRHRLRQLDMLHLLPTSIRRFLVDDRIPGGGSGGLTLVPEVRAADFARLLEVPSQDSLRYWILIGEKSVWPALAALEIRCAIEAKLHSAYQRTKMMNNHMYSWRGMAGTSPAEASNGGGSNPPPSAS